MHKAIYERFISLFPQYKDQIDVWFPNGKGSVRFRLLDKQELVFTYKENKNWSLETVTHYLKNMKRSM